VYKVKISSDLQAPSTVLILVFSMADEIQAAEHVAFFLSASYKLGRKQGFHMDIH